MRPGHPVAAAAGQPAHATVEEDQCADAGGTARLQVGGTIADAPALREVETEIGSGLQQHPRSRFAPGILATVSADAMARVIGAVVDGIDGDPMVRERIVHPAHQSLERIEAVEAAADPRLVGDDRKRKSASGEGPRHLENPIDEAAILYAMQVADLFIDDAIAIKQQTGPKHH